MLSYQNLVLVWSGNPALTAKGSYMPPNSPGMMLERDQIRAGRKELFSGCYTFAFVNVIPRCCQAILA